MAQSKELANLAVDEQDLHFDPFRLEGAEHLWYGNQLVDVRPRPLAVLRYLAERPGRLVTREELLKRLWPGIYVTKTVLRVCVREIRQALQDDPVAPRFIETVGRQGYRFIAPLTASPPVSGSGLQVASVPTGEASPRLETWNSKLDTPFIGRARELARLHAAYERVQRGERQLMFLLGEAGIGKTTVVERFLEQIGGCGPVWIGRGQCVEHHGPGEAYLPVLEALGQLCGQQGEEQVLGALRRYAPLWLMQMPGVVEAGELERGQRQARGSTQEYMLRELAEAIEALAAEMIVVLVFEDLQWSDASTLEAVAYLAQRRRPARLYILGTYRPTEVVVRGHPLRRVVQELYGRRQCEELVLELFTEAEVEEYLNWRLGRSPAVSALRQAIYTCTDGNALFLVNFVDYLLQRELLVDAGGQVELRGESTVLTEIVPDTLQQLIARQIESLSVDEQQLVEVASVCGRTFTAAEVAGVVGRAVEEVEKMCDLLASAGRLIEVVGITEWPDGTVAARYGFQHALYQQVLYEQLGQGRRVRLHRQLGERKEAGYGERAGEIAGELAVHFTAGLDYRRAMQYHGRAGESALRRGAYREAVVHCQEGLELLERVPTTPEHQRQELALRMLFSAALTVTRGFGVERLVQNLSRARELCYILNEDATLVSVLVALGRFYDVQPDREAIEKLEDEERRLLERIRDEPTLAIQLYTRLGSGSLVRGAHRQAQEHYARVLELYDPRQHRELFLQFSVDPAVVAGVLSGLSLWLTGWPDRARTQMQQSLRWAQDLNHPYSLALGLLNAAHLHLWCDDLDGAWGLAEDGVTLAREHGVAWFITVGTILQACICVRREACEESLSLLTEPVLQYRSMGAPYWIPLYLAFAADAYRQLDRVEEGLATVADALRLTEMGVDVFWAAEVYRLKGELMLAQPRVQRLASRVQTAHKAISKGQKESRVQRFAFSVHTPRCAIRDPQSEAEADAEQCFHKAIEIARQQGAKSLELRAVRSLSRLWHAQGKSRQARLLLAEVYGWFTEGFDTPDLREAKALLEALHA